MSRRHRNQPPVQTTCSYTGKIKYQAEWEAMSVKKKMTKKGILSRPLQVFECWVCGHFHLGGAGRFPDAGEAT